MRDGVTPDCYSYSGYRFRHLKKKDYTLPIRISIASARRFPGQSWKNWSRKYAGWSRNFRSF